MKFHNTDHIREYTNCHGSSGSRDRMRCCICDAYGCHNAFVCKNCILDWKAWLNENHQARNNSRSFLEWVNMTRKNGPCAECGANCPDNDYLCSGCRDD